MEKCKSLSISTRLPLTNSLESSIRFLCLRPKMMTKIINKMSDLITLAKGIQKRPSKKGS